MWGVGGRRVGQVHVFLSVCSSDADFLNSLRGTLQSRKFKTQPEVVCVPGKYSTIINVDFSRDSYLELIDVVWRELFVY